MGTLVCRVELDKTKGIVLTVENGQDAITQTIVMDGTSITTTVIQKDGSIHIDCKTFTLNAETITCKSTNKTHHESGQDFEIKSTSNVNVAATGDAKYTALNTTMESTSETKVSGITLKLSGTASAELKGPSITLDATGIMDLKSSGIVNLKGTVVNIKDIVNMG
jgi:phage gp45-like